MKYGKQLMTVGLAALMVVSMVAALKIVDRQYSGDYWVKFQGQATITDAEGSVYFVADDWSTVDIYKAPYQDFWYRGFGLYEYDDFYRLTGSGEVTVEGEMEKVHIVNYHGMGTSHVVGNGTLNFNGTARLINRTG
ncbi:hypothetical protein CMO92_00990 [Candidatus Woesearchaeota archaeon]|nr:hypothetical protein [Candidatus Woesearchaeota archaeon]|tara:strand:+ start:1583 stop:1990 length:408 start_codon:yes stop_codon:yes gene_type:complete